LKGFYQQRNVPGVMKTVDVLQTHFSIGASQLRKGLEEVITNTQFKGRWQIIGKNPTVVCDTGHNYSGVQQVMRQIFAQKFNRLFIVWGMVGDKDVKQILELLPKEAMYYFCQARIPRAIDAAALQQEAAAFGLKGEIIADVNEAKRAALSQAGPQDFVFIGGSTYVVAEVEEL
ncbi:MAG: bifunctional folylpolyglutamate synthase/dihydrofolate synthase, partial [Cyclobacteriaceae bacterium]